MILRVCCFCQCSAEVSRMIGRVRMYLYFVGSKVLLNAGRSSHHLLLSHQILKNLCLHCLNFHQDPTKSSFRLFFAQVFFLIAFWVSSVVFLSFLLYFPLLIIPWIYKWSFSKFLILFFFLFSFTSLFFFNFLLYF